MWVNEASEVNNWTVFAVGPNGAKNKNNKNNNFASSRYKPILNVLEFCRNYVID